MSKIVKKTDEEWAEWECPVCGEVASDPEFITVTSCPNGHPVILGPVEVQPQRWAETWDYE